MKTQDWVKTSAFFDDDICPTISASGVSLSVIILVYRRCVVCCSVQSEVNMCVVLMPKGEVEVTY